MYQIEEIKSILKLQKTGNKGWFIGKCQFCGKEDKLAVIFGNISSFKCHSCGEHGTLYKILLHINRLDLSDPNKRVQLSQHLKGSIEVFQEEVTEHDYFTPLQELPLGYKKLIFHPYIIERGFDRAFFKRYQVGQTHLDLRYKNYLIFPVINEGLVKGWVGRHLWSKMGIDTVNKRYKEQGSKKKILRYVNSTDADFSKLLYGYDEIIKGKTKQVIIVEGITDKFNVDYLLDLFNIDEIKCVCTFGKVLSEYQMAKLLAKEVEELILLYDPDAINYIKQYGLIANELFSSVKCGFINDLNKDAGNLIEEELLEVLSNVEDPFSYNLSKLPKLKLT